MEVVASIEKLERLLKVKGHGSTAAMDELDLLDKKCVHVCE